MTQCVANNKYKLLNISNKIVDAVSYFSNEGIVYMSHRRHGNGTPTYGRHRSNEEDCMCCALCCCVACLNSLG